MNLRTRLRMYILDNPIANVEARRIRPKSSRWFWRIVYILTALLLLFPLTALGYEPGMQLETIWVVLAILVLVNIIGFFVVVLRTIGIGIDSINREHVGKTWELVALTGADAWRVTFGKWLGVVQFVWHDYAWLSVLRVGTLILFAIKQLLIDNSQPASLYIPALLGTVLIFTILEMFMSSALGVMVGMFKWSKKAGHWVAIGIRIGLAILFIFTASYITGIIRFHPSQPIIYSDETHRFILVAILGLGDNGMLSSLVSISDAIFYGRENAIFLLGIALGMIPHVLITMISVTVANFIARRQGINRPGLLMKSKAKRMIVLEDQSRLEMVDETSEDGEEMIYGNDQRLRAHGKS